MSLHALLSPDSCSELQSLLQSSSTSCRCLQGAIVTFTKGVASELAPKKIRCNVCPPLVCCAILAHYPATLES